MQSGDRNVEGMGEARLGMGPPTNAFGEDVRVAQLENKPASKEGFFKKLLSCFKGGKKESTTEVIKFPEPMREVPDESREIPRMGPLPEFQPLKVELD